MNNRAEKLLIKTFESFESDLFDNEGNWYARFREIDDANAVAHQLNQYPINTCNQAKVNAQICDRLENDSTSQNYFSDLIEKIRQ